MHDLWHADFNLRQLPQHALRLGRGFVFRIGRHDFVQDGGAAIPLVKPQLWTLREKNLGDKPSNDKPVRPVPLAHRSFLIPAPDGPTGTVVRRTDTAAALSSVRPEPRPPVPW